MSQENPVITREQAEAFIDALNRRDFEALAGLPLDPEFEFASVITRSEGPSHVGLAGLREWAASMDSVWADHHVQVTDLHPTKDGRRLVTFRVTGRARGSGMPLDAETAQVWTTRDGKLWHSESFTSVKEALAAAGIAE